MDYPLLSKIICLSASSPSGIAIMTICGAGMCKNGAFSLFLLHAAAD